MSGSGCAWRERERKACGIVTAAIAGDAEAGYAVLKRHMGVCRRDGGRAEGGCVEVVCRKVTNEVNALRARQARVMSLAQTLTFGVHLCATSPFKTSVHC